MQQNQIRNVTGYMIQDMNVAVMGKYQKDEMIISEWFSVMKQSLVHKRFEWEIVPLLFYNSVGFHV